MTSLEVVPLRGLPLIRAGDDLVELIASALKLNSVTLRAQDVLVVAQKIVSKAEGRVVDLATIQPSAQARRACDGCREGPAACAGHSIGVGSRRAGAPRRADR